MTDVPLFADVGNKKCARCQQIKPFDDFPASLRRNGSVKLGGYCLPCQKEYQHEWYLSRREDAVAKAAARRAAQRAARPPARTPVPLPEAIGFRKHANPRMQGNAGLGIAIAYLTRVGLQVAIPLTDTQRYDLIMESERGLERVQVKTTHMKQGPNYYVHLATVGGNKSQVKIRKFEPSDYEWLFVVCGDATAYMIPTTVISARTSLSLGPKYADYSLI